MEKKKTWMSWSTGKDSAYTLYTLLESTEYEVTGLLTTVTEGYDRVAMHSTRRKLLELQAQSLGIPLKIVSIPKNCTNLIYEKSILTAVNEAMKQGVGSMAFGDLFLEDVREYREKSFSKIKIDPIFPIWKRQSTQKLANEIINLGFKAYITCIDPKVLDPSFAGRLYDKSFLEDLPEGVDPCGENGEFHTFVYDGPIFTFPISCKSGERVERDGFVFCDIEAVI